MYITSTKLYPLVKKALERVKAEYGSGYTILIAGSWVSTEKDWKGRDVAVFYTFDDLNLDVVENSLRVFAEKGEIPENEDEYLPVVIVPEPVNMWRKYRGAPLELLEEVALGGAHFDDVAEIAARAMQQYNSIIMKISRDDPYFWDGHITIEIMKVESEESPEC